MHVVKKQMDEVLRCFGRYAKQFQLTTQRYTGYDIEVGFYPFLIIKDEFIEPFLEKKRKHWIHPYQYCNIRVVQDYYRYNIHSWGTYTNKPISYDPYIRDLYLEEKKEKRLAFLSGGHCPSSGLSKITELMIHKNILKMAGL